MSVIWNDCHMIVQRGNFLQEGLPISKNHPALQAFLKESTDSGNPMCNVWWDAKKQVCFGLDLANSTIRYKHHKKYWSFENDLGEQQLFGAVRTPPDEFLLDPYFGGEFVRKKVALHFPGTAIATGYSHLKHPEIIIKEAEEVNKFKGSKVLIVGGGPTTNAVDWDPSEYDYVWSCNHFFLNEKLQSSGVALACVGGEVDLSQDNKALHEFLKKHGTICCFDNNDDHHLPDRLDSKKKIFEEYPSFYAHMRYNPRIGSVARMIVLAIFLGVEEISFVGMDGLAQGEKLGDNCPHSFESDKKWNGTVDYDVYRRHYVMLWDYILSWLHPNVKLQNLGEGHPSNQTTDISRQVFPLETK